MNGGGSRMRLAGCVLAAFAVAVAWAGAAAPEWPAVHAAVAGVGPAGSWGRAIEVPGLRTLNKGGAAVFSVSCGSAGNCAAGGDYQDSRQHEQLFAVVERHGRWGRAIGIPGLKALNTGGDAGLASVSCARTGACAAGGVYSRRGGEESGFVAMERHGRWGRAVQVPGLAALNKFGDAGVNSVSCARAGGCAAGGWYQDSTGVQGFVAVERDGRWGRAIKVPGLAALNAGRNARVLSVSCGSAGDCAAGGVYQDRAGGVQGFAVVERHGQWGRAIKVPGLAAPQVSSVSCGSAGDCAASGGPFVLLERHGRSGRTIQVPGLAALNTGKNAQVEALSCSPAGTCAAGGWYYDNRHHQHGFVAIERHGRWGRAIQVPGLAALSTGKSAEVNSVSCAPAGTCAAVGDYLTTRQFQGFAALERNGRRGKAIEIPGLGALNKGVTAIAFSVSCPRAGACAAGGDYTDGRSVDQGFVANQTR